VTVRVRVREETGRADTCQNQERDMPSLNGHLSLSDESVNRKSSSK
jgi:hypothetical protein